MRRETHVEKTEPATPCALGPRLAALQSTWPTGPEDLCAPGGRVRREAGASVVGEAVVTGNEKKRQKQRTLESASEEQKHRGHTAEAGRSRDTGIRQRHSGG